MRKMYPKQAVEIVNRLLIQHEETPTEDPLRLLSQRQLEAIAFLTRFVDEVRQARDLVRVVERLFQEGIIYPVDGQPDPTILPNEPSTQTKGSQPCEPSNKPVPR